MTTTNPSVTARDYTQIATAGESGMVQFVNSNLELVTSANKPADTDDATRIKGITGLNPVTFNIQHGNLYVFNANESDCKIILDKETAI